MRTIKTIFGLALILTSSMLFTACEEELISPDTDGDEQVIVPTEED